MTKDVLIFYLSDKKDNQISTWSTIEEIDIDSQADLIGCNQLQVIRAK